MGKHPVETVDRKIKKNEKLTLSEFLLTVTWTATWKEFGKWATLNIISKPRFHYQWSGLFDAFSQDNSREQAFTTPHDVRVKVKCLGQAMMNAADAHLAVDSYAQLEKCGAELALLLAELDRVRTGKYERLGVGKR